ncbi:MAG: aspartate/glutamate racemase family protein [Pygmaiobacter sp.]
MSWESTVTYYQIVNEVINEQLGGLHSAKVLLYSVDFQEIEQYQTDGEWGESADILSTAARHLEQAGADFIVICTNTMHKVAPEIQSRLHIPILHIAEATAEQLLEHQIHTVALLGTKYTMQQDFYKDKLISAGIQVIIPADTDAELVNRVIFDELCRGIISPKSKDDYLRIIAELQQQGAQGVVLGCTEIGLLIQQEDTPLPVFDTAQIHARKAALYAIGQ